MIRFRFEEKQNLKRIIIFAYRCPANLRAEILEVQLNRATVRALRQQVAQLVFVLHRLSHFDFCNAIN